MIVSLSSDMVLPVMESSDMVSRFWDFSVEYEND